mmetsp:Transcript_8016/g.15960  ORF Transcript_8016/g.15960 Transcript_8016/m.15960 type:complete len:270 (-) Transcript_8016:865-1674(-)
MDINLIPFFIMDDKKKNWKNRVVIEIISFQLSFQGFFRIWKFFKFPQKARRFFCHTENLFQICSTKDQKILISCLTDGIIKIWEMFSKRILRTINFKRKNLKKIAIGPETNILVAIFPEIIYFCNTDQGTFIFNIPFFSKTCPNFKFSKSEKIFVVEGIDGTMSFFDLHERMFFKKIELHKFAIKFSQPLEPLLLVPFFGFNFLTELNFQEVSGCIFRFGKKKILRKKYAFCYSNTNNPEGFFWSSFFSFLEISNFRKIWDKETRLIIF